jgi:hypothetical protein
MPLLLEDLAGDAAHALRRAADRFESAAKELARPGATGDEIARLARHLTDYAVAELPRAEAMWKWQTDQPQEQPDEEVERRLVALQAGFAQQARMCVIARGVWKQAESLGRTPERAEELEKAWRRLVQLERRAKSDRENRGKVWQPKDPERFAEAMRQLEGAAVKFVSAEEARKWFRSAEAPRPEAEG